MTFLNGVYYRQAFQFHRAVSGLCRREGSASALYESELILVSLDEGEADAVEAGCVRQDDILDIRVEWLQHCGGRQCLLCVFEVQVVFR